MAAYLARGRLIISKARPQQTKTWNIRYLAECYKSHNDAGHWRKLLVGQGVRERSLNYSIE